MADPQAADRAHIARPEPGSPEAPLRLTDPRKLRALAHPARIAIMQHLAIDGPATATECASIAGLSPSACSYHLRALARHGFVTDDPASAADGRQRPWRAKVIAITYGDDPNQPPGVRAAGRLLTEILEERIGQIKARYLERESEYDQGWRASAGLNQDVLHVTADELALVRSQLHDVFARYRRLDPASRPAGARRVHVMFDLAPWFDPDSPA